MWIISAHICKRRQAQCQTQYFCEIFYLNGYAITKNLISATKRIDFSAMERLNTVKTGWFIAFSQFAFVLWRKFSVVKAEIGMISDAIGDFACVMSDKRHKISGLTHRATNVSRETMFRAT